MLGLALQERGVLMKYLIRNPLTKKWLSDGVEVTEPDDATRIFTSRQAVYACVRVLEGQNKRLNLMYRDAKFPEHYEVVPFTLMEM